MRNTAKTIPVNTFYSVEVDYGSYTGARDPDANEDRFSIEAEKLAFTVCQEIAKVHHKNSPKSAPGHWFDVARNQSAGPCFYAMIEVHFKHPTPAKAFAEQLPALAKACRVKIN